MDFAKLVNTRKSKTKRFIRKLKPHYHNFHRNSMPSESTLVDDNEIYILSKRSDSRSSSEKKYHREITPFEKLSYDVISACQKYDQILQLTTALQININNIKDRQFRSYEDIKELKEQNNIQKEEIKKQKVVIDEQRSFIKKLFKKNKNNESRIEKMENLLLEHEKKFVEMQKIIDKYQENGKVIVAQDTKPMETSPVSIVLEDSSKSIDTLKSKYLILDIVKRIENLNTKEKKYIEQVNHLQNNFHDENEVIHKLFDEIQHRLNIFGVKKYDEIISCLDIYKKYVDLPINELMEIEKLDLSKKHIYTIANGFSLLDNIKNIDLMDNYLKEFPMELTKMTNLVEINLSYNDIINIPPEIKQLNNLQKLSLSNNSIISIPKEIGCLTKLYSINLSNNKINKIPENFFDLKNLKWIFLNNNKIEEISKDILELPFLELLYIGNNSLKNIPEELLSSKKIIGLNEHENCTDSIPRTFFNLSSAIVLDKISN